MQRRGALLFAGLIGLPLLSSIPSPAQAAAACSVQYSVTSQWQGGFQGSLAIKNTGDAIGTWSLAFTFPNGQTVTQGWGGVFTLGASAVTVKNESYNGSLATGASATAGFIGTWTGSNSAPTSFALNGVTCGGSVPTVSLSTTTTRSTSSTTTTRPVTTTTTTTTKPVTTTTTTKPVTTTTTTSASSSGTPLAINGQLHVCGVNLCNQYNKPIQLRGMSTHGLQWFYQCYNSASMDALAYDWKADVLRIAMYVNENGYVTDPSGFTAKVNNLVDMAEARGMYAIIDFHILTPGDPSANLSNAKTFFASVSARNAAKKNVIYEIANEPNGVSWSTIKSYAETVIPIIRANDPDGVVIVGTRGWSSLGVSDGSSSSEIIANPVNATNIMYTFHFYAASHGDNYRSALSAAAAKLPIFVTEFGTVSASGGGSMDTASSTTWLNLLDSLKIGYANWTYSDAGESSAAFKSGTCSGSTYAGTSVLTDSGAFVRSRIMTADNFPTS